MDPRYKDRTRYLKDRTKKWMKHDGMYAGPSHSSSVWSGGEKFVRPSRLHWASSNRWANQSAMKSWDGAELRFRGGVKSWLEYSTAGRKYSTNHNSDLFIIYLYISINSAIIKRYAWRVVRISPDLVNILKAAHWRFYKTYQKRGNKALNRDTSNLYIHHPCYNSLGFTCCETVFTKHCICVNH